MDPKIFIHWISVLSQPSLFPLLVTGSEYAAMPTGLHTIHI